MSYILDSLIEGRERQVTIMVKSEDLMEFAHRIMEEAQKGAIEEIEKKKEEEYLDRTAVKEILKVCDTTLWKWNNRGKLVPQKIGARNVYKKSDVMAVLDGKR